MAIEPASNGADDLTDSSIDDAALIKEALHQRLHPQPAAQEASGSATQAHAFSEENRLHSPQVALSRGINAFNAFSRAEEEATLIQNDSTRLYSEQPEDAVIPSRQNASRQDSLRNYSRTEAQVGDPSATASKKRRGWFGLKSNQPAERQNSEIGYSSSPLGRSPSETLPFFPDAALDPALANPLAPEAGQYVINPLDGSTVFVPAPPALSWWEKQPYYAVVHLLAIGGTITAAWLFGILVAQVLPGSFQQPPLQEAVLRKSSRLTRQLWNMPQLWHTPTAEVRIEAIPLPETGPVLAPISLSPLEKQPLVDELNAIETEILTLDRRMQTLEKRLGKPPYQGADVESRVNALRATIDPPVQSGRSQEVAQGEAYQPQPLDPNEQLLEVAQLKVVLPSDALFTPGQSNLKGTPLQEKLLNQVLDQLINYPKATIVIRSYSDDQAKSTDSRDYTLAQANTLSDYLQASLPEQYRWVAVGGGQAQPVDSNTEDTGRQRNRRIEILVDTRWRGPS